MKAIKPLVIAVLLAVTSCQTGSQTIGDIYFDTVRDGVVFGNSTIEMLFDRSLKCQIRYKKPEGELLVNRSGATMPTHFLVGNQGPIEGFKLDPKNASVEKISNEFGSGSKLTLRASHEDSELEQILTVELYERYPNTMVTQTTFTNRGDQPIDVKELVSNYYEVNSTVESEQTSAPGLWTFQGIAYAWGSDYVFPLKPGFKRENFSGFQRRSRMGGGVPVTDVWSKEFGLAVASIEKKPKMHYFPTKVSDDGKTEISIRQTLQEALAGGESLTSVRTATIVHSLDFYAPLAEYSSLMRDQGVEMKEPSELTYEPFWCGWGYGSDFTPQDIYDVIPKLKELNIKWIVVDDGWFDKYGDWNPRKETFPGGEEELKQFVDSLHEQGFLVKIWWAPILAQPAAPPPGGKMPVTTPGVADIVMRHPEWLVKNEDGEYARCPRNMYFLNGSLPAVQDYIKQLTQKFIKEWGFDGHKLDAYWVIPPSYDSLTSDPALSYESVPTFIKTIYETSKELKPYSVTEICNCGVPQDFYQSVFTDQPVVADPTSFLQVRHRVKLNKALWGPQCPVFTDHVEHIKVGPNELGRDFASTIGTGGVPGTKFTWPKGPENVRLTPEKEEHWKKWFSLYNKKMLSKGDYLNLYDVAFDVPEAHAIKKDSALYYAFYADQWEGDLELRGLDNTQYTVRDYVNDRDMGTVAGPVGRLAAKFEGHLLLECIPNN
jgi:alpha-galactosidase